VVNPITPSAPTQSRTRPAQATNGGSHVVGLLQTVDAAGRCGGYGPQHEHLGQRRYKSVQIYHAQWDAPAWLESYLGWRAFGTPTTATNVTFTLLADDAYSCSGTQQYTVAISGPFMITAITKQSNDVLVAWSCLGSQSYVLQSTRGTAMIASFNTNFADASSLVAVSLAGASTHTVAPVGTKR